MPSPSVLQDLDDLHSFLEHKEFHPGTSRLSYDGPSSTPPRPVVPSSSHHGSTRMYEQPTAGAHTQAPSTMSHAAPSLYQPSTMDAAPSVRIGDRLGGAIQAAEMEMQAALQRTNEVHMSKVRAKEMELAELHRQNTAKDRTIDGLRDMLATNKRSYEGRIAQLEDALHAKTSQVAQLSQEKQAAARERQAATAHVDRAAALHEQEVTQQKARHAHQVQELKAQHGELKALNADLTQTARARAEEARTAQAAANADRADLARAAREVKDMRKQIESLQDKLMVAKVEARNEREQLDASTAELKRKYKIERTLRKACEKWMRSELKSREELSVLLGVLKEASGTKNLGFADNFAQEDAEVRSLLAEMAQMNRSRSPSPERPMLLKDRSSPSTTKYEPSVVSDDLSLAPRRLQQPPRLSPRHLEKMNGSPRNEDSSRLQRSSPRYQDSVQPRSSPRYQDSVQPRSSPRTYQDSRMMQPHRLEGDLRSDVYTPSSAAVQELSAKHRAATEENQRLRAELAASKRVVEQRIRGF